MKNNQLVDPSMLLFQNRYQPITSEMGFLNTNINQILDAYKTWQQDICANSRISFLVKTVHQPLEKILADLQRTLPDDKSVFIPTANSWTAYIDNGISGTDAESIILYLSQKIGCSGVKLVACPNTITSEQKNARGSYGQLCFCYRAPSQEEDLGYTRVICLTNDAGRWDFTNIGSAFSFETTATYNAKNKLERFTFHHLKLYLQELGIKAFEENYYKTLEKGAVIVHKKKPWLFS